MMGSTGRSAVTRHRGTGRRGQHIISFQVSPQNRISLTECIWVFQGGRVGAMAASVPLGF